MNAEISEAVRKPEPELHLTILDQEMIEKRPNFLRAGTGSVLVHIVIRHSVIQSRRANFSAA